MATVTARKPARKSTTPADLPALPRYRQVLDAMLSKRTPNAIRDAVIAAWNRAAFHKSNAQLDDDELAVMCYRESARVLARHLAAAPVKPVAPVAPAPKSRFEPSEQDIAWWNQHSPLNNTPGTYDVVSRPARRQTTRFRAPSDRSREDNTEACEVRGSAMGHYA